MQRATTEEEWPGRAGGNARDEGEEADEDDAAGDEDAVLNINPKEAFMAVGTIEKISAKHGVPINLGKEKDKPISLTDAATAITADMKFSLTKWSKSRRELFGMKASSAGSRLPPVAIVSSALSGFLGKHANKL